MPWRPLPRIAFAVAVYPFQPSSPADLPLELGDELYIIEQGGADGSWYRGYLVAPPSLLAGLTSVKGQTLEARVFSGIFPRSCVEVREVLGDADGQKGLQNGDVNGREQTNGVHGDSKENDVPVQNGDAVGADALAAALTKSKKRHSRKTSDPKSARRISRIKAGKLNEDGTPARDSDVSQEVQQSQQSSLPITPVSLSPRDPDAPKPAAPVPMLKIGDETPTSSSEPLVDEIASCLREWHSTNLHELLLARQYVTLEKMSNIVSQLDLSRRQLLHNVLTAQERVSLREQTVWNLVRGNKMLSGEIIVRDPVQRGRLLTGDDSPIELTRLQSVMSLLDTGPTSQSESVALHHLLFEVKALAGTNSESMTLTAYLCLKEIDGPLKPLSETFALDVPSYESFANLARTSKMKTLFTDLSSADIGEGSAAATQLYLVIKVQSNQIPKPNTVPPKSRSSVSKDGALTNKSANAINASGKGSLKGGRRSLMFGSKPKGASQVDRDQSSRQNGRVPPQTGDSDATTGGNSNSEASAGRETTVVRTVAVGLLNFSLIMRQEKDVEQVINIWSPSAMSEEEEEKSVEFDDLIRGLLFSPTGRYTRNHRAARIHTHFYPFANADAESLVRKNPTLMHMVTQTPRIGFSEAPTKSRSDIYLTVSEAVMPQDALLSHPKTGLVQISQSSALHNLQLTLEVRDGNGVRIDHCIYPSSNSAGHTAWRTTATERGSGWHQTVRLNIPTEQVPGSHLVMSLADAPEFPFALSWMPLWNEQAFIRDGTHSLLLHAYDRSTSSIENGKGAYLSLPWSALSRNQTTKDETVTGPVASLALDTYLCSTEYSQDQVILGLISWRDHSSTKVLELLKRIVFVPEIEIVKQLNDVFDALFGILVDHAGNEEYEDLVFNDLVTVLGIVHDRRFNLGPLVDQYADNQFNFPFATPCLIRSYARLLQASSDPQEARHLRAAFKVGRHLLKFIVNAREQQKSKEEGIGITSIQSTFNHDMHAIFKSLSKIMQNQSPILVGSKTLIVQHFHSWLPELSGCFTNEEVLRIAIDFMEACKDVKGKLILYRLILLLNYAHLDVFSSPSDRRILVRNCARWLAPYWGETDHVTEQYRDQVRLCSSIVSEQVKQPGPELYDYMPKIVASYCAIEAVRANEKTSLSMLFSKSYPFQVKPSDSRQTFDEALVELAAILAAISDIRNTRPMVLKDAEIANYLSQALNAHKSVLSCEAYPESWLSVHIYHHRSTMKSLEYLSTILTNSFLPSPEDAEKFNMELWKAFFTTLLKLVGSDALALETFPEQKRRAVWKIAGDVREHGADLLRRSWEAIGWDTSPDDSRRYGLRKSGGYQVQYVPSLVSPIVELCLSVHEGLRRVAVEVLQTMIVSEWALSEDLSMIEAEMIASLDLIFKSKHLNESITQKLFIGELLDMFEPIASSEPEDPLWTALKELVGTIDELLDLLVSAHSGTPTESLHTLKLMEFMKDMQKEDIFIRYVHELARVQAVSRNFTEAGLALQFHADLYDWDPNISVPALESPPHHAQSSFDRKEALYFEMIQHYEDGKSWSHALASYRELADHYEHTTLDFVKLARTQRAMANIHDSIAKDDRHTPRYFRVMYKGLGFPTTLRDKQFIIEGSQSERMAAFTDRMQKQHPNAQVVASGEIQDVEGQFLQISSVSPHRDLHHPVYQRMRVPQSVREHLLTSTPSRFSVTSKRQTAGTNVKEQWVEKTIFTTAEPFPTILRRSEIVASEDVKLTPLQTAVERTWRKTQELHLLEKRVTTGDDANFSALTEALSQLIDVDSPSATCVALYRQFLPEKKAETGEPNTGDEAPDGEASPEEADDKLLDPVENALAVALGDHVLAIKRCLGLYSRPSHQATRDDLTQRFEAAFAPELASLAPAPVEARSYSSSDKPPRLSLDHTEPKISLDTAQPGTTSRVMSPEPEFYVRGSKVDPKPTLPEKSSNRLSLNFLKRGTRDSTFMTPQATMAEVTASAPDPTPAPASTSAPAPVSQPEVSRQPEVKVNGVSEDTTRPTRENVAKNNAASSSLERSQSQSRSRGREKSEPRSPSETRRSWFDEDFGTPAASHPPPSSTAAALSDDGQTPNRFGTGALASTLRDPTTRDSQRGGGGARDDTTSAPPSVSAATDDDRPFTAETGTTASSSGVRNSVKKRFSLLRVGKKSSRGSVKGGKGPGSVAEE